MKKKNLISSKETKTNRTKKVTNNSNPKVKIRRIKKKIKRMIRRINNNKRILQFQGASRRNLRRLKKSMQSKMKRKEKQDCNF